MRFSRSMLGDCGSGRARPFRSRASARRAGAGREERRYHRQGIGPGQDPRLRSAGARARGQAAGAQRQASRIQDAADQGDPARGPDQVAKLVEESKSPNVDVQILFAFNSAEILPEARPSLDELGKALSDPKLTGGTFLIAGHTDAKGSDAYNLALVAAARGVGEGLPGRDLPCRRRPAFGDRLRRGAAQEQGGSARRREPPGADRQYRKCHRRRRQASAVGGPSAGSSTSGRGRAPAERRPRPRQPLPLSKLTRRALRRRGSAA